MSGKARPSLRKSIPLKLELSNLSKTSKDCINEVFRRYELLISAIETIESENEFHIYDSTNEYDDGWIDGEKYVLEELRHCLEVEHNGQIM